MKETEAQAIQRFSDAMHHKMMLRRSWHNLTVEKIEKIVENIHFKPNTKECWEYNGTRSSYGYGQIRHGKILRIHRLVASVFLNKILSSKDFVCHHCDNPPCVNPSHIYIGTAKDNMRDAIKRGRIDYKNIGTLGSPDGEKNRGAKLKENQVRYIRSLYKTGNFKQCELAKFFQISHRTISLIVRNKTWTKI